MSRVWLDAAARDAIALEAAARRLRETGGGLFGYEAGDDLVIHHALPPGPRAQHRRTRFIPNSEDTQDDIDRIFESSLGALSYLGEWHSHPRGSSKPSRVDQQGAARVAGGPETDVASPVVLIQATKPFRVHVGIGQLAAYRWAPEEGRLKLCDLVVLQLNEQSEPGPS